MRLKYFLVLSKYEIFYFFKVFFSFSVLQISVLDIKIPEKPVATQTTSTKSDWRRLLTDPPITIAAGAIWFTTTAMAVLEPCLPLWLMGNMSPPPQKWQLGTVFIPDSLGYLLGTNFTGLVAGSFEKWKIGLGAMVLVGVCATLVRIYVL